MENPTLVDMESVKCDRFDKRDFRGSQVVVEALVQGFSDGSTRVLCDELEEGKCRKENDKKPCIFVIDSIQK
jgi:hypothetical protein